jgi:hypothetical protein
VHVNEYLWGWDATPGIVSVWAEHDGRATVWRRPGPAGALAITLLARLTVTVPLGLAGAAAYLRLGRPAPVRPAVQ